MSKLITGLRSKPSLISIIPNFNVLLDQLTLIQVANFMIGQLTINNNLLKFKFYEKSN